MNARLKRFTIIAMIAALYTAVSLALAPITYGNIQVRVAEALTLLPIIYTPAIWGVTLGCALTNLIGAMMGINVLGFMDVFVGTFATFLAAICTYKLRKIEFMGLPLLAASMPVIFNALIIGLELTVVFYPAASFMMGYLISGFEVGLGELVSCFILGIPLIKVLSKTKIFKEN
ncbi:QueT transporter family protein [Anaerorhabdus sp.]|uniref:QueT transporter family protein n=1 Tax=Anaerorhabdus sp. TaxID=1872524 RepID=UPI002FC93D21